MSIKLIQAYALQTVATLAININEWRSNDPKPTLTKSYPIRPTLVHRIFIPESHIPDSTNKYPLYINIHGGGFMIGNPQMDDFHCHYLANKFNIVVVSVQYSLAPQYPFPTAVHDVCEVAAAIIADSSLPIDTTKCVIGGTSAGGNLALAAPQIEPLKGKLQASIGIVAPVDFTLSGEQRLESRWVKDRDDFLAGKAPIFDSAYQRASPDTKDPLLSPRHAKREDLPPYIYMVSAELDMLSDEQLHMASELAGKLPVTYVDGRPAEEAWELEGGRVKWEMVKGHEHMFTHNQRQAAQGVYDRIGEWLFRCVFKP